MKQYVLGFLFHTAGYVVLIEKFRPNWQYGKLNGVGGKIEERETPLQAMQREFREEAGLDIDTWKQQVIMKSVDWEVFVFSAETDNIWGVSTQTDEPIRIVHTKYLPLNTIVNLNWLIPLCQDKELPSQIIQY